jgi:trehalose 6-phosphate phosphatase
LPAAAALFLDFDGTLAPIAPRPQDVCVPAWVRPVLHGLLAELGGAVAIVSGRPVAQLDAFLDPLRLACAGLHGAEWRAASGVLERFHQPPPRGVVDAAAALAARHPGLILETKASGLSLHFRARPELEVACRDALAAALAAAPGGSSDWEWLRGHAVLELKPRAVSKGFAVQRLLATPPFAGRRPVFVGDDLTDEDGIRVAQAAGGFGVRVGPGATQARHRLPSTGAVGDWLAAALRRGAPD